MPGMRSLVALALLSRALALPTTSSPTTDGLTTTNDSSNDSQNTLFVDAKLAQDICNRLKDIGENDARCDNLMLFSAPDLCRSAMTGGASKTGSLAKLALGKLAHGKDEAGGDSDSTSSTLRQTAAKVKLGKADGDDDHLNLNSVTAPLECDESSSTSTSSATLSASATFDASASASQTLAARHLDSIVASHLASLTTKTPSESTSSAHASATRAARDVLTAIRFASLAVASTGSATTSESASPTGYSRSGADSSAMSLDSLTNTFTSGSSTAEDDEPEYNEDALAARGLELATRVASLAATSTHAASSTENATPTGYITSEELSDSYSVVSAMDSQDTTKEDENDMPVF